MEQLILNLVPGGVSPVCYVSQYDVGRKIRLHLRNGSDPYVLSGAETVTATIRKVSGEELIYDIANTSASYVDMIVNYDATDVIGESVCELIITQSGIRLGSANFKMRIDPDVYSGDQKLEVVSATSETPNLSFETNVEENLLELKAGLFPVQDLHGYDTPWIDSNEVNKEPYIKRAVAGTASRIGNHFYDKLVGGTVAFNQLASTTSIDSPQTFANVIFTKGDNASWNASGTANGRVQTTNIYDRFYTITGHKYAVIINKDITPLVFRENNSSLGQTTQSTIFACTEGKNAYITLDSRADITGTIVNLQNIVINIFDLTAMFGSTIADYIYSLEQATAGAGVAWFKALFPNDYYAYNAGELMSVKATAHVMKNANNQIIGNYALDSNLELRGIPKLDANNKLYYDGDTYGSTGKVTRRYGIVDLGSLNWSEGFSGFYTSGLQNLVKKPATFADNNFICEKFIFGNTQSADNIYFQALSTSYAGILVALPATTYETADVFKSAVSGVYMVYELATPTEETADPFTNPQVCDENGTEEYIDSRIPAIPVGHETYQANICEITGFDELNIQRCGVNLWDEEWEQGAYDENGEKTGWVNAIRSKGYIGVTPSSTIYVHFGTSARFFYYWYASDKQFISRSTINSSGVITVPNNAYFITFGTNNDYGTTYNNDISINYPATDTQYHAYTGNTYTIAFGQTVYGGTLDVTRGKLHVTHGIVDLGTLSRWEYNSLQNFWHHVISDIKSNTNNVLCEAYTYVSKSWASMTNGEFGISGTSMRLHNDTVSTSAELETQLNGIHLVYELSTPFDIDLTPEQIEALLGVNNVWHDANGGTEVKFFRMISAS